MIINRIVSDLLESNMYIIIQDKRAIIIDPCRNTDIPEGVVPEMIILTHEHYDHISGVNKWKTKFNVPVLCSSKCNERIQSAKKNMARYFEAFCKLQTGLDNRVPEDFDPFFECSADNVFESDTEFIWQGHSIKLMILPGHSPGSIGIIIDDCVFSGDSIFEDHDTELKFPGGSAKDWEKISLPKIKNLPLETVVYPGHFDSFKLRNWYKYKKETQNGILC